MNKELMQLDNKAVEKVDELRSLIDKAVESANQITVLTVESVGEASHYIKSFSGLEKRIDETRLELTRPLDARKKAIMDYFESLKTIFRGEQARLGKEVLAWNARQKQIEREKQEEARREAEERALNEAILKEQEMKAQGIKNPIVEPAIVPEEIITEKRLGNYNTSGVTEVRVAKWRVTEELSVPRTFLMLDESKITQHRRSKGVDAESDIAGIEFYYETVLRR